MSAEYPEVYQPNYSGFVVIGAGLSRTGTSSLRCALAKLLDGACYHMLNIGAGTKMDLDFWDKALKGSNNSRDWVDFFERRGFRAGVDFPVAMFYKELMAAYPSAKVILTVRDPVKWYQSVSNSILYISHLHKDLACTLMMKLSGSHPSLAMAERISRHVIPGGFDTGMFTAVEAGEAAAVAFYNRWVEEVKRSVPKDRLLVFSVRQGWKPLCAFLEVPTVPEEPFPNINDTAEVKRLVMGFKVFSYAVVYGLPVVAAVAVGATVWYLRA